MLIKLIWHTSSIEVDIVRTWSIEVDLMGWSLIIVNIWFVDKDGDLNSQVLAKSSFPFFC